MGFPSFFFPRSAIHVIHTRAQRNVDARVGCGLLGIHTTSDVSTRSLLLHLSGLHVIRAFPKNLVWHGIPDLKSQSDAHTFTLHYYDEHGKVYPCSVCFLGGAFDHIMGAGVEQAPAPMKKAMGESGERSRQGPLIPCVCVVSLPRRTGMCSTSITYPFLRKETAKLHFHHLIR